MALQLTAASPVFSDNPYLQASKYIQDLSLNPRIGFQGKNVAESLLDEGLDLPEKPNQCLSQNGLVVVRLIGDEYWVLAESKHVDLPSIEDKLGCYSVPCQDGYAWFSLSLSENLALMANICATDLTGMQFGELIQTVIAGVNVKIIYHQLADKATFSLFCDRSMANFLMYVFDDLLESNI